jgi:caffeoyl-CoA O-methyltransferase
MSFIPQEIEKYCIDHTSSASPLALELMNYTRSTVHGSHMLIGELEGAILQFLIKLRQVKTVVELGTFTGYSALIMAEALPTDGKLITIDINSETSRLAQSFWDRSIHGKKIHQILKPGLEALADLNEKFDLIFIDADKNNYSNYLTWALEHLNSQGLIITDNALWYGKVLQSGIDRQTDAIRAHNNLARQLQGYTKILLPIRDGMYLIFKD